jgi:spore coat polysaccharide biosynthesis protein SpsF
MRTVCIVQARMGSKRLPGKVLLPLNGHTVIGEVLSRCKRIPGVDEVICAIPNTHGE